jgi:hypothetical protein
MASNTITLSGRLTITPPAAVVSSLTAQVLFDIMKKLPADDFIDTPYTLVADAPAVVAFGGVATLGASILMLSSDQPITALLTSGAGAAQAIPCDDMIILFAKSVPFTALSLVRPPGIISKVRVVLAALGS